MKIIMVYICLVHNILDRKNLDKNFFCCFLLFFVFNDSPIFLLKQGKTPRVKTGVAWVFC